MAEKILNNGIMPGAGLKGAQYIVEGDGSLDARFVVNTESTLTDSSAWQLTIAGKTVKTLPYVGLTTYAKDTLKLYVCTAVGEDNLFDGIQWKEVGKETPLDGYATETWVEGKGYLVESDLSDYAKKADISTVYRFIGTQRNNWFVGSYLDQNSDDDYYHTLILDEDGTVLNADVIAINPERISTLGLKTGDVYTNTSEVRIAEYYCINTENNTSEDPWSGETIEAPVLGTVWTTYPAGTNFVFVEELKIYHGESHSGYLIFPAHWDALAGISDYYKYENVIETINIQTDETTVTPLDVDYDNKSVTIDLSGINSRLDTLEGFEEKLVPTTEGVESPAILAFDGNDVIWSSTELQKELPDTEGNDGKYLMVGPENKPIWTSAAAFSINETDEEDVVLSAMLVQEEEVINLYSSEKIDSLLSWETL